MPNPACPCGAYTDSNDTLCRDCSQVAYCTDGCGQPATTQRLIGIHDPRPLQKYGLTENELTEVVELVCQHHKDNPHA